MTLDINKQDLKVGVIGTGTMGRGIAQVAAHAGIEVRMFDSKPGVVEAARKSISDALAKLVAKGSVTQERHDATMTNLKSVDTLGAMRDCDIVVEAIIEKLDVKVALFRELEGIVRDDAILATNTSSLSVTAIAAGCKHPGRVGGWHAFNPVPLMKLVEVIEGALTESWVTQALLGLATRVGHTPVIAKDMPGFIVNHAGRGIGSEGFRLVSEGIAPTHQIDRIMRDVAGFRMGPFELGDLVGVDVGLQVAESIYNQFYQEPRFRITPFMAQRVAAGLLGRKTKRGYYDYADGSAAPIADDPVPPNVGIPVWVSDADPELAERVRTALSNDGAQVEGGSRASSEALIVVTPVAKDTSTTCVEQGLDARRTVAVEALFPMHKRRTVMCSPATSKEYRDAAHALFAAGGVPVSVIRDSPGFVASRIVAHIISISCDIAQQRIATPQDIDLAVKLGLNYPNGPLAMGDALGAKRILAILDELHGFYGDPRYRPSAWLRRRAMLGLSLLQND
jgi:3-hydroxybutyryl-CoA dehydrogenase